MIGVELGRELDSIRRDGRRIADLTRAAPAAQVVSCPKWTGADLLAHVGGFARLVCDLVSAGGAQPEPRPPVDVAAAGSTYDADLARLIAVLADTPPEAPVFNWSVTAPVAGFWSRRAVQELAVHRWDAGTIGGGEPAPIATDVALAGIGEFFEVFVATGLAAGMVPPAAVTLVLEITDVDQRREYPLPGPGPRTTMRGTASDLLLALWRRHDPLSLHAGGDPAVLAAWPSI
jgi:uncharacterized protein (TIGR03083 family)